MFLGDVLVILILACVWLLLLIVVTGVIIHVSDQARWIKENPSVVKYFRQESRSVLYFVGGALLGFLLGVCTRFIP